MNVQLELSMTEAVQILAKHMGAENVQSWSFSANGGEPVIRMCAFDAPPAFAEHDPYSDVMGWCARNLAADNELRRCSRPDFASAMWAGVRKAELLRQAMDDKRRERDDRLRAAEARLKPLGPFAAGHILAAIREVAR
ncbi:TPA: hypothetical protein SAO08_002676 [Burkholderia multivorans]|nr:hypothetical protein [Burkholderia multivorans]